MTRDEIIRMAREAGGNELMRIDGAQDSVVALMGNETIHRFANLVAAAAIEQGRKEERALWEMARIGQEIEQEPVAWYYAGSDVEWRSVALDADLDDKQKANCIPLYIAPPQREFVGLTDEEVDDVQYTVDCRLYRSFARAIEAKLKEKNND